MIKMLKEEAVEHGDKLQLIPIERLLNLHHELQAFEENEELNGFQKWIINDLYKFDVPEVGFTIKSIILIALPHPSHAKIEFISRGEEYNFVSLVMPDFDRTEKYLKDFLAIKNYHIEEAPNIPMKRLAAQSGLAAYGKNNICYIEGMGSMFSFAAYFTDITCKEKEDDWSSMRHTDACANCLICQNNCPTGAIRADRFLIDNEKCLSFFNEGPGDFPDWLPTSAHHSLYDCLKCQMKCPMNKDYVNHMIGPIKFDENETDMLLTGNPYENFSPELKDKAKLLGFDKWLPAIPRNLKTLIKLSNEND